MDEIKPEAAEEIISFALGQSNITTLKDVKHGMQARSRGARMHIAGRILEQIRLCGYAIIRIRPPVPDHSTGPGFKPRPEERPSSGQSKPD